MQQKLIHFWSKKKQILLLDGRILHHLTAEKIFFFQFHFPHTNSLIIKFVEMLISQNTGYFQSFPFNC